MKTLAKLKYRRENDLDNLKWHDTNVCIECRDLKDLRDLTDWRDSHQLPGLKERTKCMKEDCFIHISSASASKNGWKTVGKNTGNKFKTIWGEILIKSWEWLH